MKPAYTAILHSPYGVRQRTLKIIRLECTLSANEVSILDLEVALDGVQTQIRADSQIHVWRSAAGQGQKLLADKIWLARRWRFNRMPDGLWTFQIRALCPNNLLERRIVAYAAGSSQASKASTPADDMIKEIYDENLGKSAAAARQFSSTYLAVAPDKSEATNLDYAFSWRQVLTVFQSITDLAWAKNGERVYFDVYYAGNGLLLLDTYLNGIRRNNAYEPPHVRLDNKGLGSVLVTEEYDGAASYAYIGGQGQEAARVIGEAENTNVSDGSPFGRIEVFQQASNEPDQDVLDNMALVELGQRTPAKSAVLSLQDAPGFRFGKDWFWGLPIGLDIAGITSEAIMSQVQISLIDGEETITARTEIRRPLLVPTRIRSPIPPDDGWNH